MKTIKLRAPVANQTLRAMEIESRVEEVSAEYGQDFGEIYRAALNAVPLEKRLDPYKILHSIRGPYLKQFQAAVLQQGAVRGKT